MTKTRDFQETMRCFSGKCRSMNWQSYGTASVSERDKESRWDYCAQPFRQWMNFYLERSVLIPLASPPRPVGNSTQLTHLALEQCLCSAKGAK